MARRRHLILHFTGAGVAKLAPPFVQFVLLLVVARDGSLDDVGRLALASAAAFLCGAIAELGLATSFSVPKATFGTDGPPLRATRALRLSSGVLGCVLFVLLWAGGLGGHDHALLLIAPLPFALALSYGYGGAMNASGMLRYEIPVSLGESAVILALALIGTLAVPALPASLAALSIGRGLGLVARMALVHRMPQSRVKHLPRVVHAQLPFALATVAFVVHGQADMLALGLIGALATAAVYGPMLRTAYSTLLSAEGLSWALFGDANPDERDSSSRLAQRWRPITFALGVALAAIFVLLAQPFLRLLLDRELPDLTQAVVLFGSVIVVRFGTLILHVDILRAGRQRDEIPVLFLSAVVLAIGGAFAASANSLPGLAGARLASEALIAAAFVVVRRRGPATTRQQSPAEQSPRAGPLRLLVLTPFPPRLDAAHGGARVIAQLVARLGDHMTIAVLCLRHPSELPADKGVVDRVALLQEVPRHEVVSAGARALRAVRWRAALLRGRPFWVSDLRCRTYRKQLEGLVRHFRPDIVQLEYVPMAQYLPALGGSRAPRVLVEYDPVAGTAREGRPWLGRLDALAWRRFRRRALRGVDVAVVFTARDGATLEPLAGDTPIVQIPFGTDLASRALSVAESDGSVLFVGNFVHSPNADAARRLVTSIFPGVRESHPRCVLYVVGDCPPPELEEEAGPGVIVTGWVPDLAPYLERAAVVVAPLRHGGGMRVKVLEALAAGKAVVASPLATEGLGVADRRQFRSATADDEFVARISELLDDANAREELEKGARSWARENLSWDSSVEAYEHLYAQLLNRSQSVNTPQVGPKPGSDSQTRTIHSP